jgi:hypothetical protein
LNLLFSRCLPKDSNYIGIEAEQEMVNANKKLVEIFEQKIKDKIGEVWGE